MLVELVERLGFDFDWWLDQPLAFLRWCYLHLQEIDHRRRWDYQLGDVDRAWLMAKAFHEPNTLKAEQMRIIDSAASVDAGEAAIAKGMKMLEDLETGQVMSGLMSGEDPELDYVD